VGSQEIKNQFTASYFTDAGVESQLDVYVLVGYLYRHLRIWRVLFLAIWHRPRSEKKIGFELGARDFVRARADRDTRAEDEHVFRVRSRS